jgi:hypothetical protein
MKKYAIIRENAYSPEHDLPVLPMWRDMDAENGGPAEALRRLQNAVLEYAPREAPYGTATKEEGEEEVNYRVWLKVTVNFKH